MVNENAHQSNEHEIGASDFGPLILEPTSEFVPNLLHDIFNGVRIACIYAELPLERIDGGVETEELELHGFERSEHSLRSGDF